MSALTSTGFCNACQHEVSDAMVVGYVERGSGPPPAVLACVAHARGLVRDAPQYAPAWLAGDLAQLDAGTLP